MQIGNTMNTMILAIDTALCGTNLALFQPESGVYETLFLPEMRGQSSHIVPQIKSLIDQAGKNFTDISHIVAVTGPGSFTGIRVGLAAANALQLGTSATLVGVSGFAAYRAMQPVGDLAVILETFRDDYFMAVYEGNASQPAQTSIVTSDAIPKDMQRCGSGLIRLQSRNVDEVKIDWRIALTHLLHSGQLSHETTEQTLSPYYMRDADTSVSRQMQWQISK